MSVKGRYRYISQLFSNLSSKIGNEVRALILISNVLHFKYWHSYLLSFHSNLMTETYTCPLIY